MASLTGLDFRWGCSPGAGGAGGTLESPSPQRLCRKRYHALQSPKCTKWDRLAEWEYRRCGLAPPSARTGRRGASRCRASSAILWPRRPVHRSAPPRATAGLFWCRGLARRPAGRQGEVRPDHRDRDDAGAAIRVAVVDVVAAGPPRALVSRAATCAPRAGRRPF